MEDAIAKLTAQTNKLGAEMGKRDAKEEERARAAEEAQAKRDEQMLELAAAAKKTQEQLAHVAKAQERSNQAAELLSRSMAAFLDTARADATSRERANRGIAMSPELEVEMGAIGEELGRG